MVVLVGVFVTGTTGYVYISDVTYGDAAYMMVITLSTVGYSAPFELDAAGTAWTMAVITVGLVSVSVSVTSLVAIFVSGELRAQLGSRKVETQIGRLKDHVIVCGHGRMGRLIVKKLMDSGESVVVIERQPDSPDELRDEWLDGIENVGITSGASTPEELVQAVIDFLEPESVTPIEGADEDVSFVLPRELR
ncbi:MAG: NAD-binding protein [Chloroflexi bacterium]|nr:NAD-binding protein [Chloroflexota bacterium]